MKEYSDYDAVQHLTFFLNAKDRVIGTHEPTVYVKWEGGSRENMNGFILHWGTRAIHFRASYELKIIDDPKTKKREQFLEWTITNIGLQSWKTDVRPSQFADLAEKRVACELAVKALAIFPLTYSQIAAHTSAKLSEALRGSLYGRIH